MTGLNKALTIVCALGLATAASATEFATNGDFSSGDPYGTPVTVTAPAEYGGSAATGFQTYNFNGSTGGNTTTTRIASIFGRTDVLRITSDGGGIFQFYGGGSPLYGYADVYVLSGIASFSMCDGYCGGNNYSVASTTTGQWQRLSLTAPLNTNELSLYASPGAADFYVDTISISDVAPPSAVPEPNSWALMVGGFGIAGTMMRRRRQLAAA